ncbi:MAG: UDP-N-acetylglucosamine 2-epimerase (non-hydrolyzing) [Pseudomonadota bacterium]
MEQLRIPLEADRRAKPLRQRRIACIFGTRPEAIKMAPVIQALADDAETQPLVILTGQHRELLDQVTDLFGLKIAANLNVMQVAQGPGAVTAAILTKLPPVLEDLAPDCVLVHGDTTTTLAAGLAAFYAGIPVGHVEAGLRTGDMTAPWPEEMNRKLVAGLATMHFAPTAGAADNLIREGVDPARIEVTGNTAIDALAWVRQTAMADPDTARDMKICFPWLDPTRRLLLVTGHRRENQDGGLARVAAALIRLAGRGDLQIAWPVHPNPKVKAALDQVLIHAPGGQHIHMIEPLGYRAFAWLMGRAELIITDSGGIQEEAPSLGKPVLVTREVTERPEAVAAGTVRLVGTSTERIVAEASRLLDDWDAYQAMARTINPYGDGKAAGRIQARLVRELVG